MNNYTYQTYQYDATERQQKAQQQIRAQETKPKDDNDNRRERNNR